MKFLILFAMIMALIAASCNLGECLTQGFCGPCSTYCSHCGDPAGCITTCGTASDQACPAC